MFICQSESPNSSQTCFPPWYPYICFLCLCLYFCFAKKIIYAIFLNSTYLGFSFPDLLHSVWQPLGPSMSLQMIQFCPFLWLIPHCIYVPHLLCWECFIMAIINNAAIKTGVHVSFWIMVFSGICPLVGLLGHVIVLYLVFKLTFLPTV